MNRLLILSIICFIAIMVSGVFARMYVIVEDPNTIKIESRTVTTFGVTNTTLTAAPNDPNYFLLTVRFKIKEL